MNALVSAIVAKYTAANTLKTALYVDAEYTGLYHAHAPQGANFPFAVFGVIGRDLDYAFSDETEAVTVYFNVYTETGQLHAGQLLGYLLDLYDDCNLTVTGWRALQCVRDFVGGLDDIDRDPPIYGWHVEYEMLLEKTR